MICRGCGIEIQRKDERRAFVIDTWTFCCRECFAQNAARLFSLLLPVLRHVAGRHRSTAARLVSMALRSDSPVPLL